MKTSEFDFKIPPELIAHEPATRRDRSRLMVLDRARRSTEHKHFYDIVDYLQPGDLLVLNNTKVMPANLVGKKEEGGAKVEVLLVSRKQAASSKQVWECLVRPGKRLRVGSRVLFGAGEVVGQVLAKTETGEQIIEFSGNLQKFMKSSGQVPLPPYIKPQSSNLAERYQTVYAEKEGASAAPTAGLHFTPGLLEKIKAKGVAIAQVTLHTGLATFKPVYAENVEEHKMYTESYEMPAGTIKSIKKAKRVIAVGTTSVRTLETVFGSKSQRLAGETDLFIYPGYYL
jgi:S-adenosylmethionine:tRNA ribosyltransferase-isomerase